MSAQGIALGVDSVKIKVPTGRPYSPAYLGSEFGMKAALVMIVRVFVMGLGPPRWVPLGLERIVERFPGRCPFLDSVKP